MLKKRFTVMFVIVAGLALAQGASAALYLEPPDWENDPTATYQIWNFDTADNPTHADNAQNPYGNPLASIEYEGITPWIDNYLGHQGVWRVEDWLKVHIPNDDKLSPPPMKNIWMQMVFTVGPECQNCESQIFTQPAYASIDILEVEALDENFVRATYMITLEPAPASEDIYILPRDCEIYIDSLTIHTVPVPEPATLALLAIGSAFTMIKKRKTNS